MPRLGAISVALIIHAGICVAASNSPLFLPYAAAGSLLVFMTIFNHTFMFGTIAKLDPSGRAASSTPAMLTLGAAIGPALGGAVVQFVGFTAIGWVSAGHPRRERRLFCRDRQLTRVCPAARYGVSRTVRIVE